MVSLLELGNSGGFVYGIFVGVGEGWWLRIWVLYWSWGIMVASYIVSLLELGIGGGSYMVTLLELGKGGGFVYGIFIGVGQEWWLRI